MREFDRYGELVRPLGEVQGYEHLQSTPSAAWTIVHGLGRRPGSVTVWVNNEIMGCEVKHLDDNTTVLRFNDAYAGIATLR